MTQWIIDIWDLFEPELSKENKDSKPPYIRRIVPNILPGMTYARALALYIREESSGDKVRVSRDPHDQPSLTRSQSHEGSSKALEYAIRTFPSVVPLLADKADISQSGEVRSHPAFKIQVDNR